VGLAWLSGLLVYNLFDRCWGSLPIRLPGEWIDLHGTVGVALLPLAVLFAVYAFSLGRRQLGRASNAVALAALALAIGTGKLMQEDWLRAGELHHLAYSLHLLAWVGMAAAVLIHLSGVMRRGGLPMLGSMVSIQTRKGDLPGDWPHQLRRFLRSGPTP
jgi:hypothetical protein